MTPTKHLTKFPDCRSSTLTHLIEREKIQDQLRKEIAVRRRCELFARFLRIVGMGRR